MAENYKSLSELSVLDTPVDVLDLILISRRPSGTNSDYVSYCAPVSAFAKALSDIIANPISEYTHDGMKDLTSMSHAEIEANGDHRLTSYVPIGDAGHIEAPDTSAHAISAIQWNDEKKIIGISSVNLEEISASILNDVVDMLKKRNINSGIHITSKVGTEGILLAETNTGDAIYSGNPRNNINIEQKSTIGDEIARVTYCDGVEVSIKDNLSVQQVNPEYGANLTYCGDTIATINGTTLKNNLSVTSLTDNGLNIANINGIDIKNGSVVTTTTVGSPIATINGTTINNGIDVNSVQTVGKPIFKINDILLYNNVDFIDNTSKTGDEIATVNGNKIYNNVVIEQDEANWLTKINGLKVMGGIKLGQVTPVATTGNVIAKIQTPDAGVANIYSGIVLEDIKTLISNAIDELKRQHDADIAALYNYVNSTFLKLNSATRQTVVGPVSYSTTIAGNITNADTALTAKWQ